MIDLTPWTVTIPDCPAYFQTVRKHSRLSINFPGLNYVLTWFQANFVDICKNFPGLQKFTVGNADAPTGFFCLCPKLCNLFPFVYVALSDPGVIWGHKYHLCRFAWKLKFGHWNHQRCIPWWQKMQKRAEKWPKKTFLNFLALWPRRLWSIFTPYVCYLEGISTIWATPYEVKSLN